MAIPEMAVITLLPEPLDLFETIFDYDDAGDFDEENTYAGTRCHIWVSNATPRDLECHFKIPEENIEEEALSRESETVFTGIVSAGQSEKLSFDIDEDQVKLGRFARLFSKLKLDLHVKHIASDHTSNIPEILPKRVKVGRGVIITDQLQIIRCEGVKKRKERWIPHRSIGDDRKTYDPRQEHPELNDEVVDVVFDQNVTNASLISLGKVEGKFYRGCTKGNDLDTYKYTKKFIIKSTSTWEHTGGTSLKAGTSFGAKVPLIADGKVNFEGTVQYGLKKGTLEEETVEETIEKGGSIPPNHKVIVTAEFFKYSCDVPYTMKLKSGEVLKGVFRKRQYSHFTVNVDEVQLNDTVDEVQLNDTAPNLLTSIFQKLWF